MAHLEGPLSKDESVVMIIGLKYIFKFSFRREEWHTNKQILR